MADWKNISGLNWTYTDGAPSSPSGNTTIQVQYDADSKSPTSLKVRFKYSSDTSSNYWDSMYVLYDPSSESSPGTIYKIKDNTSGGGNWPYYTSAITLTKNYTTESFTLQNFWICNNGNTAITVNAKNFYNNFKSGGARQYWAMRKSSQSISDISGTVATNVGNGTISITDNGNNTFTIQVDAGSAGSNNAITNTQLAWGYYGENYKNTINDGGTYDDATNTNRVRRKDKSLEIETPSNATRNVYAKCITEGTYNTTTVTDSLAIKQYVRPSNPGQPKISYKRKRLTLKENWVFSWTKATQTNSSSPVKGYRIRVYKNGTAITGLTFSQADGFIKKTSGTNSFVDVDSLAVPNPTFAFNPTSLGFEVGNTVKVGIYAYTRNALNDNSGLFSSDHQVSEAVTVQNAGVMRVKTSSGWQEGQVYVRVNGAWKEAVSVNVKTNNGWKEST